MDNHSLRSRASQATLVSLLELDPAPIESLDTDKDLPPLPDEAREHAGNNNNSNNKSGSASPSTPSFKTSSTASSIGLSGSSHGPVYYCALPPPRSTSGEKIG